MKSTKQAVIVFQSVTTCNDVCRRLKQMDFANVCVVDNATELRKQLRNKNEELILFAALELPLTLAAANIRAALGVGTLVVVTDQAHPLLISDLLIAGADVAMSSLSDGYFTELLAWKTALRRRSEGLFRLYQQSTLIPLESESAKEPTSGASAGPVWRLVDAGWRLLSPDNKSITLTYSEKFFLSCFAGEMDKRLSRNELLEHSAILNENSRAIDSLVSRLRRKAADKDFALPIKSIHGWGYSFSGFLQSDMDGFVHDTGVDETQEQEPPQISLSTVEEFQNLMETDRFDFTYQLIENSHKGDYYGAKACLVWTDAQGKIRPIEELRPHLLHLGVVEALFSWALRKLNTELQFWLTKYDLHLPVFVAVPAYALVKDYLSLQQIIEEASVTPQLNIIVYHVDHQVDVVVLSRIIKKLKSKGVFVWLRHEGPQSTKLLEQGLGFIGISLLGQLTKEQIQKSDFSYEKSLHFAERKNLGVMCEDSADAQQREQAEACGVQYLVGDVVSLPLSRDGLLLAWASRVS